MGIQSPFFCLTCYYEEWKQTANLRAVTQKAVRGLMSGIQGKVIAGDVRTVVRLIRATTGSLNREMSSRSSAAIGGAPGVGKIAP